MRRGSEDSSSQSSHKVQQNIPEYSLPSLGVLWSVPWIDVLLAHNGKQDPEGLSLLPVIHLSWPFRLKWLLLWESTSDGTYRPVPCPCSWQVHPCSSSLWASAPPCPWQWHALIAWIWFSFFLLTPALNFKCNLEIIPWESDTYWKFTLLSCLPQLLP